MRELRETRYGILNMFKTCGKWRRAPLDQSPFSTIKITSPLQQYVYNEQVLSVFDDDVFEAGDKWQFAASFPIWLLFWVAQCCSTTPFSGVFVYMDSDRIYCAGAGGAECSLLGACSWRTGACPAGSGELTLLQLLAMVTECSAGSVTHRKLVRGPTARSSHHSPA